VVSGKGPSAADSAGDKIIYRPVDRWNLSGQEEVEREDLRPKFSIRGMMQRALYCAERHAAE